MDGIALHHLLRAMAFFGEELGDQTGAAPFSPCCTMDLIEEELFHLHRHRYRNLFTGLDLVFFDTTLGRFGPSKNNAPSLFP